MSDAQEKWKRLTNPKTVEDYGLSMTESELIEFEEGRKIVAAMRMELDARMNVVAKMIAVGNRVRPTIERVTYGVLTVHPLNPNETHSAG